MASRLGRNHPVNVFLPGMFAGWTFGQQRAAIRARLELLERSQQLEEEIIRISERDNSGSGVIFMMEYANTSRQSDIVHPC